MLQLLVGVALDGATSTMRKSAILSSEWQGGLADMCKLGNDAHVPDAEGQRENGPWCVRKHALECLLVLQRHCDDEGFRTLAGRIFLSLTVGLQTSSSTRFMIRRARTLHAASRPSTERPAAPCRFAAHARPPRRAAPAADVATPRLALVLPHLQPPLSLRSRVCGTHARRWTTLARVPWGCVSRTRTASLAALPTP